ncbi:MAG: conjugative transposon protein TraJ [Ferruginibacter sp.]|nr:conjugative transposon protein TraJ [Ferruginibacter sp.]
MRKWVIVAIMVVVEVSVPLLMRAQGLGVEIHSLHSVLDALYDDMMPLCSQLIGVGRGIAGFAATWYIASRVWRHIANAEPIDFYPLFRPFVLGFAIMIFPSVLAMINGVMKPTITATFGIVKNSDKAIETLLKQKEDAIKKTVSWQMYVGASGDGDRDKWYQYTFDENSNEEGWMEGVGNSVRFAMSKFHYNMKNTIKEWLSEILKLFYEAAALCINTIRTFHLVVLAILGPLVFGIAVFDGFQHTLTVWIARYLNIFLWLPVANIFGAIMGKIQENMLKLDINQIQDNGDTFFSSTDMAYMIFMIIGIAGYFTVPSIANYIIHAGGSNSLLHRVTTGFTSATRSVSSSTSSAAGSIVRDVYGDARNVMQGGLGGQGGDYFKDRLSGK